MSDYPMLISNKLHSFRNFSKQLLKIIAKKRFSYLRNYYICTDYYTMV